MYTVQCTMYTVHCTLYNRNLHDLCTYKVLRILFLLQKKGILYPDIRPLAKDARNARV